MYWKTGAPCPSTSSQSLRGDGPSDSSREVYCGNLSSSLQIWGNERSHAHALNSYRVATGSRADRFAGHDCL